MIHEYKGLEKAAHIHKELTGMVTLRATCRACGLVAAHRGSEDPPGLGAVLPDELMDKVAKLNVANVFWRVMALAGDIRGGLIVTLPSLKGLRNHEVNKYVEEFYSFGTEEPIENMLKVHKLLQNWTAGLHRVGTWHGCGPIMAQKIMQKRVISMTLRKNSSNGCQA